MRLLTHNMLLCNTKRCLTECGEAKTDDAGPPNFPLMILPAKEGGVVVRDAEFREDLVRNMLSKLDWAALRLGAQCVGVADLPEAPPTTEQLTEEVLRKLHHLLFEVHVQEGQLQCRHCERMFPISNGIPNMLLNDDEV
mmetsp:Transcript_17961/g.57433  ORF Transcript_17961/g.57433 Transcript_17961/m.57433 type:complete len:139 (-) Transcript_17961:85-501(-)